MALMHNLLVLQINFKMQYSIIVQETPNTYLRPMLHLGTLSQRATLQLPFQNLLTSPCKPLRRRSF